MKVVNTLDQYILRRWTETESGRRRRGPVQGSQGRSSSSPPKIQLTWSRKWCDTDAVCDGKPRLDGR